MSLGAFLHVLRGYKAITIGLLTLPIKLCYSLTNIKDNIMWTKPEATEMRFGFEITMYVANR